MACVLVCFARMCTHMACVHVCFAKMCTSLLSRSDQAATQIHLNMALVTYCALVWGTRGRCAHWGGAGLCQRQAKAGVYKYLAVLKLAK